ncbi:ATP-binding cassette domain-containing protein [Metamycoplasma sualvi]|uniref:ATP-binding cassette domain-containing protein n=1 Tax=Metamycoplasma sualvi TaxID=2125 RepID=UPI0038730AB6
MKIKVLDITHTFQSNIVEKFDAISNVKFNINENEYIGIIGPTGSGKTTLIEHLNGLLIPTKGSVEFDYSITKYNKKTKSEKVINKTKVIKKSWKKIKNINEIRRLVGIVFQFSEYQLFEETVEKDIIFGPINMGISKEEALKIAKESIVKVGLDVSFLNKNPFELSGGQKRRVAIAGILSMKPKILIFDEPTAGLDPEGSYEILKLFDQLSQEGTTIIIVTHDLDHVLEHTKRTIFIRKGKIIKDGPTLDILSDEKLLIENKMSIPKIINLTNRINRKYQMNIPYCTNVDQFTKIINKIRKEKK